MMRLHLLGLPHTVTDDAASHCAYTAKCLKFPTMMAPHGYEITHYGVEGATVECEHVDIMTQAEQRQLKGSDTQFVGDAANTESPLYREFNRRLRAALRDRVTLNDLVLLPFGHGHAEAVQGLPFTIVESGIGYPSLYAGAQFRIFESYAWMHWHQGRANEQGKNYCWTVPNYFDVEAWDFRAEPTEIWTEELSERKIERPTPDHVVYFGRICDIKGLPTVVEIAKRRPDLRFTICGQGDPSPYLTTPNIEYRAPISGRERSALLGSARAVLTPSVYTEPFGGVAVEAMMCGTPVLSTAYGAFTETIEDEVSGFRCHTLGDWLAALDRVPELDREYISNRARRLYGFERIGKMYDRVFRMIADLHCDGWYSMDSAFARRNG